LKEADMRILSTLLILLVACLSLVDTALAAEPALVAETATQGEEVRGEVLSGKLILSSPQGYQVLTADGKEVYSAQLEPDQALVTSDDGEYFGITTYSKQASPGLLAAEKFELYASDGSKLFEIQKPGVSGFFISPGARTIVGISGGEGEPQSQVNFYGSNGNQLSTTRIKSPQGAGFSPDGKRVLINSAQDGLLLFESGGRLIAKLGPCDRFAVSSDGGFVATASGKNTRLHEVGKTGRELRPAGSPVRSLCFSPDGKYLGLIDKTDLYLFEVETTKLLWQHTLEQPGLSFVSLDLSDSGVRTIAGLDLDEGGSVPAEERHTKGLTYLFDKQGELIWQTEVTYQRWGAMFPLVKISADGSRFSIATREKVYLYTNVLPQE
jgi:outer membrane protein assembly factor BamB